MNASPQMFPKPPKRMLQPRKAQIRWQAELAEAQLAYRRAPLWVRLLPVLTAPLRSSK